MGLFVAIDCNAEKEYFKRLQGQLPKDGAKLSLTGDFHLTLKFLGEVMPRKIEKAKEALRVVEFAPFSFSLSDVGVFPDESSPRVVWVGIGPQESSIELQKNIEKALHGLFEKEKRFHPHITLARIRGMEQPKDFIEKIKIIRVEKRMICVRRFHLVNSTVTPHGSVYEHILSIEARDR